MQDKIKEFRERKVSLTYKKYLEIKKECNETFQEEKKELTIEQLINIRNKLYKGTEEAEIKFASYQEFIDFSMNYFKYLFKDIRWVIFVLSQILHELEHSLQFFALKIPVYFGWHKFKSEKIEGRYDYCAFYYPYGEKYEALSEIVKAKLKYMSIKKVVTKPSKEDLEDIKRLEEKYPSFKGFPL